MISLMLMAGNDKEGEFLASSLEDLNITVIASKPSYANYIKTLQYMPDIVLMEIPVKYSDQVHFIQMLKQHDKARHIPVFGYGNGLPPPLKEGLHKIGMQLFLQRPINVNLLTQSVKDSLKKQNKNLSAKPRPQSSEEDILTTAKILSPSVSRSDKVTFMTSRISELMAFPFTVSRVLHLASQDSSGAEDLARVIEADPVITANILKVANSVMFARNTRKIASIKDAIVRIGFAETRRIVMSMSVLMLMDTLSQSLGFDRKNFWLHCLTTAILSRQFAKQIGTINTDLAFLAGLLHDFGIILLDEFFPLVFAKILQLTTDTGANFIEKEEDYLRVTHIDLVQKLFANWGLPEAISDAIAGHYSIHRGRIAPKTPQELLALCTCMSDIIAKSFNIGATCDQYVYPIQNWAFDAVKMPSGLDTDAEDDLYRELTMYLQFLKIDPGKLRHHEHTLGEQPPLIGFVNLTNRIYIEAETYLHSLGYPTQRIAGKKSYSDIDLQFDLVIACVNQNTTKAELEPLLKIIARQNSGEESKEKAVPVLALIMKGATILNDPIMEGISSMYDEFDLRQLESNINAILKGKPIQVAKEKNA